MRQMEVFMDKNFLTGKLSEYVRIKDELVETEEISAQGQRSAGQ